MRFLNCCRIQRSDTMRRGSLKTSKSSVQELKATKKHGEADALSIVSRSVSMNAG